MKKTYRKPEIFIAQVKVETILDATSGPKLLDTSASQSAGMDAKIRGTRTSDDFDDLW